MAKKSTGKDHFLLNSLDSPFPPQYMSVQVVEQVIGHFPLNYGDFILLLIPVFQIRGLGTWTIRDQGKEGFKYLSFFLILCLYVSPYLQWTLSLALRAPVGTFHSNSQVKP